MTLGTMSLTWNLTTSSTLLPPGTNSSEQTPVSAVPRLSVGVKVTLSVLMVIIMIGGLLGNSVVCLIVYQKPAMRSAINLLLANMALAHILLDASCLPFAAVTLWVQEWVFGGAICRILIFLHRLFISEAVTVLLAISIDRYLIIVLRRDKLTPTRAKVMICVSWFFSVALNFPPMIGWGRYGYYESWIQCVLTEHDSTADTAYAILSMTLIFYAPISLLSYTYLSIIDTVRKRSNRVHARNCLDNIPVGQITQLGLSVIAHPPPIVGVDIRFKTRTFKTILVLFIVYVTCWLPYSVAMLYWNLSRTMRWAALPGNWLIILGYMNTVINPCVYCWRINKFREACLDLLPGTLGLCTKIPQKTKRRIDPSGPYKVEVCSPSM